MDSVKISYFDNSSKKYLSDLSYAIDYYANKGILTSRKIGSSSGNMEIKTYYIEYPSNLKKDTIFVYYNKPSINNGCVYRLAAVKFNTKVAVIDTFKYQPVYLFEKM